MVLDTEGRPVPGWIVFARLRDGSAAGASAEPTGADGRFTLELFPGTYDLVVATDERFLSSEVDLEAVDGVVEVRLPGAQA